MPRHGKQTKCPCTLPIQQQIQHFIPYLKQITRAKDFKTKKKLFLQKPKCLTKFLSECSGALLRRDIELPLNKYKKLRPHKNNLILLSHPKVKQADKIKFFLKKKGGFLSLIPIIGTILANTVIPFLIDKFRKH